MAKVRIVKPKSFLDFVRFVEDLQNGNPDSLWYRGCGKSSHKLLPSLYRHKTIKKIDELAKLEYQLITRFRQMSIPFHSRSLEDDWNALFFMQHYSVPTRLLDWTENPFIAFYFAVMYALFGIKRNGAIKYKNSAAVWMLNPVAWNKRALKHLSFDGGILATSDEEIGIYRPGSVLIGGNTLPVAMYGSHNSPRIVAQRGVFTIFGRSTASMEMIRETLIFPKDCLIKIVLEDKFLPEMRRSILSHGITESVIFPDLEGLAKELRRTFKFEV